MSKKKKSGTSKAGCGMRVLFSLLSVVVVVVGAGVYAMEPQWASVAGLQHAALIVDDCAPKPLCSSAIDSFFSESALLTNTLQRLYCFVSSSPIDPQSQEFEKMVIERFDALVEHQFSGQRHVVKGVRDALINKLESPFEPLVMHFAGDNGVGKTTLAQLVSLALAFRCAGHECEVGDNTLVLSGVSYDGLTVQQFRESVVDAVVEHTTKFKSNGVIIFNEFSSLQQEHVSVILPLLGRAANFPEAPDVDLRRLTVIMTTDFGRAGSTKDLNLEDIRQRIHRDFADIYSRLSMIHMKTFPFLPISMDAAKKVAEVALKNYACRYKDIVESARFDGEALEWILEDIKDDLSLENGRVVAKAVSHRLGPKFAQLRARSHPTRLRLVVGVSAHGDLELRQL